MAFKDNSKQTFSRVDEARRKSCITCTDLGDLKTKLLLYLHRSAQLVLTAGGKYHDYEPQSTGS
jgi:hypothetical protein